MKDNPANRMYPTIAMIILDIALLVGVWAIPTALKIQAPELILALVVILGVSVLITLLFIMAGGFASLNLADRKQALGLPDGSIRALIALFLLMSFIIVILFVFRLVGIQDPKANYEITDQGRQLAPQLITLLGTLVGTISGFYFGTSITKGQRTTADNETALGGILSVGTITPNEGLATGSILIRQLVGTGFVEGVQVKLRRTNEPDITAAYTEVLSPTRIICTFDLTGKSLGIWDVIVTKPDETEATLRAAFEIKSA